MLLVKNEMVVHGMIGKLIETGRYYGMEMNAEKLLQLESQCNHSQYRL